MSWLDEICCGDPDVITPLLNENLIGPLLDRYNNEYAPDILFHLPSEPVVSDRDARARLGLLIEYAVITILHEMIGADSRGDYCVTFNTTNMFADFYVREGATVPTLRIDVKAFQENSGEASPRMATPVDEIEAGRDFILAARWDWRLVDSALGKVCIPRIEGAAFASCIAIARERDVRQRLAGNFPAGGGVGARTGKGTADTNYGKLNRIVHASRRNSPSLHPDVVNLLKLIPGQS